MKGLGSGRFEAALAIAACVFGGRGVAFGQVQPSPTFTLSFSPCSTEISAAPGSSIRRSFDVVLTTRDNPAANDGAQGWSISLSADGLTIAGITTAGTAAAKVTDNPPGLLQNGFEKSEVATEHNSGGCEGRVGAVSAVVLGFTENITLPASGSATIARVTVIGEAPVLLGDRAPASLLFVDGCGGAG